MLPAVGIHQLFVSCVVLQLVVTTKLHTLVGSSDHGKTAGGRQTIFTFLGQQIGRVCLCAVLSIGINRLRRALEVIPDMRIGVSRKGVRQQDSQSVNAFLGILYNGVAETLPDRLGAGKQFLIPRENKTYVSSIFS